MSIDLRHRRARGYRRIDRLPDADRYCFLQDDQTVANAPGATVRADINANLQALVTLSSGTSAPSTTWAYMLWADTTNGLLKQRNAANTGWLVRGTLAEVFVVARSSNTIVGVGDFNKTLICTGSWTQTVTAAATLADGFVFHIRNAGTGTITLDPNSSETVDGATTIAIGPGESFSVFCNGSAFYTVGRDPAVSLGAMAITSAGEVTFPLQPAFLAQMSSNATNATGDGTAYVLACNTEITDKNSDYNNSTYTFTAPVTGSYDFSVAGEVTNLSVGHTSIGVYLVTSNRTYTLLRQNPYAGMAAGAVTYGFSCSLVGVDMDAADTAYIWVIVSGSTKTVTVNGTTAIFSGKLAN
jgi:hypothetical protein